MPEPPRVYLARFAAAERRRHKTLPRDMAWSRANTTLAAAVVAISLSVYLEVFLGLRTMAESPCRVLTLTRLMKCREKGVPSVKTDLLTTERRVLARVIGEG